MDDFTSKIQNMLQRDQDKRAETKRLNDARLKSEDDDRKLFVSTVREHLASMIPSVNHVLRQFDHGALELTDAAGSGQFNSVTLTYQPAKSAGTTTMVLSISPTRKVSCKSGGAVLRETSMSAPRPERFEIEEELQTFLKHVLMIEA